MRNIFDKVLGSKPFYIIFSILVSIVLWTYVAVIENPDVPVTLNSVMIEFSGLEELSSNNLVITDIDVDELSLRFVGKRNNVSKLSDSNVSATVDLSEIVRKGVSGVYQLPYDVHYPDDVDVGDISVTSSSVRFITVTVEKMLTKLVPVTSTNNVEVAKDYQAEPMTFDVNMVEVSGPNDVISRIVAANVLLERKNVTETIEEDLPFVFVDAEGKEVSSQFLICEQDKIRVTLKINMVKEVSLLVNFIEGSGATKDDLRVSYEPESITLSGDPDILKDINQIILGNIDLTTFAVSTTESFKIPIPNGAENLTGATEATVQVEVVGFYTKRLSASNIQIINAPSDDVTVITQSLDVTIRCKDERKLEAIEASNIRIVADLSDVSKSTGTYAVKAKVHVDVDDVHNIGAVGEYVVTVTIRN